MNTEPTAYQSALLVRALCAERYTERHRALWRGVYKQAALTVRHFKLRIEAEELVDFWLTITEPEVSDNRIALDDLQTGFQTIAQESGAVVVPIEALEEFGDTWVEAPEDAEQGRLEAALEWHYGLHPVTEHQNLPSWCDGHANRDAESHLEPLRGFEALSGPVTRR